MVGSSLLIWFSAPLQAEPGEPLPPPLELTVGVVPQFPPSEIHASWNPLLLELGSISSLKLRLKSYPSIPAFEQGFLREMDLAYLNPYHVLMAHQAAGYLPLLRDSKRRLAGILVVRKESPIRSIAQLQGATIAFPHPMPLALRYMRALLTRQGGNQLQGRLY